MGFYISCCEIKDHLGNVRAVVEENNTTDLNAYADYYPFGLKLRYKANAYRYGYQGEFAEDETEEMGYNTFELRSYDPVVGRWTSVDPYRHFSSGYVSVGNNPVVYTDPTGGICDECPQTEKYQSVINDPDVIYGYDESIGVLMPDAIIETSSLEVWGSYMMYPDILVEKIWNSPFSRIIIPDYYNISLSAEAMLFIGADASPINFTILTRGQDPGVYYTPSVGWSAGVGGGKSADINLSRGTYFGNLKNFNSNILVGSTHNFQVGAKFVGGASIHGGVSLPSNKSDYGLFIYGISIGAGLDAKVGYNNSQTLVAKPIIKF